MYTVEHDPFEVKHTENVQLTFTITDLAGDPVTGLATATGIYRVGKKPGDTAYMEKTSGSGAIVFDANTAVVNFVANEVKKAGQQVFGNVCGQLFVSISGEELVVVEGNMKIEDTLR